MKTRIKKTIMPLMLITALCISSISYQPKTAEAANDGYTTLLDKQCDHAVNPGETVSHDFTLPTTGDFDIDVYTYPNTTMVTTITKDNTEVYNRTVASIDTNWNTVYSQDGTVNSYRYTFSLRPQIAGAYTLTLSFTDTCAYRVVITQYPQTQTQTPAPPTPTPVKTPTPSLSEQSIVLTAGFSQKISTYNTSGKVTWSSKKKSVATVKNGKITGKKPGTTTITAKTASGYTMSCKVTVKKNVYSVKKAAVSDIEYDKSALDIYKVSYDKKGNLVIKARMLNNKPNLLKRIEDMKIWIKTKNGKTIGVYSAKRINNVNLNAGKAKKYTFKIKKAKLKKKKKADLRQIISEASGRSIFIR